MSVGIYKITSPIGSVYIGQSWDIERRFMHYGVKNINQTLLKKSLQEHGKAAHKFDIVHELPPDVSQFVLNEYEALYVSSYKDCGVDMLNIKVGGGGGRKRTEEEKDKVRGENHYTFGKPKEQHHLFGKKFPEKSLKLSGVNNHNYGKPLSEERKRQHSERMKGENHPFFGKKRPEHSVKLKGENSYLFGKKGAKSPASKKIIDTSNGKIYDIVDDAANEFGIKVSVLRKYLCGNRVNITTLKYL